MKRLIALAAGVCALGLSNAANAATTLRIASYLPEGSVTVSRILKPFVKNVEEASKGEIKFQTFWGGSLGRDPEKQYKLMTDGIADIVYMSAFTASGQFPDTTLTQLPGIVKDSHTGSIALWSMYKDGMLRGFDKMKLIGTFLTPPSYLHMAEKFSSLEDLKGKKIIAPGPEVAEFVRQIGATPVYSTMPDAPLALSSGLADGIIIDWSGFATFKLQNLAKHHYEIPLGATQLIVAMNQKSWDRLSKAQQKIISRFAGIHMVRAGGDAFDSASAERRAQTLKQEGNTLLDATDEKIAQDLRRYGQPVYDAWVKATENGAKKLQAMRDKLAAQQDDAGKTGRQ